MSSKNYWVKRAVELEKSIQDGATGAVDNIAKAYERAIANINHEIQQIFREFAKASDISEEAAHKIINATTSKDLYKDLIKLLNETEDKKTRQEIETKINRQAYGARIDRLEAVKERAYIELKKAQNVENEVHKALHKDTLQKSYYTNIYNTAKGLNAGVNFSLLPKKAIEKALTANWLGSNYSKRIWNNNEQFISKVQQTIEDGIIGGHSISKMADKLCEYVKTPNSGQRYIAERLVRSETAHFMAEGQLEAYKEICIKRYQFVSALSENTCIDCGNLDGEEFDVTEVRAGDNYPPIHTNCRCTTVMAGTSSATRIARDPLTGKNYKVDGSMTFVEWKDSLSDEQRAMLKYVDKSAGSGIINYAKASDIFLYEKDDIPSSARILPEHIIKNLEMSPIGRETIKYIENNNIAIYLNYEKQPHSDRGHQRGNVIKIYIDNILNETVAAQTVIHDVTHARYNIGSCQWAEAVCMAQEKKHITGKDKLTFSEKRYVIGLAKKNYPEYNWKRGGYSDGKYF